METCPVLYVDPFNIVAPKTDTEIHFGKNFRYAYQKEFRFVWIPKNPTCLKEIYLSIGDISDISEIITKEN